MLGCGTGLNFDEDEADFETFTGKRMGGKANISPRPPNLNRLLGARVFQS